MKKNNTTYPSYGTPFLNISFDIKDVYQPIYFSHIYGSTFTISMKIHEIQKNTNGIKKIIASFKSNIMGGTINFALKSLSSKVAVNTINLTNNQRLFEFDFILNAFTNLDVDFDPAELTFEEEFSVSRGDIILISIPPSKKISGITDDALNLNLYSNSDSTEELIDGGWDCKLRII